MVSKVPIRPPMLKIAVAWVFQDSTNMLVAVLSMPSRSASTCARLAATTGMNALQLHQVTNAITATTKALRVCGQSCGVKISRNRGGGAVAAVFSQRSGSLTRVRIQNANAAGSKPKSST